MDFFSKAAGFPVSSAQVRGLFHCHYHSGSCCLFTLLSCRATIDFALSEAPTLLFPLSSASINIRFRFNSRSGAHKVTALHIMSSIAGHESLRRNVKWSQFLTEQMTARVQALLLSLSLSSVGIVCQDITFTLIVFLDFSIIRIVMFVETVNLWLQRQLRRNTTACIMVSTIRRLEKMTPQWLKNTLAAILQLLMLEHCFEWPCRWIPVKTYQACIWWRYSTLQRSWRRFNKFGNCMGCFD